jgi:uncharacterized protein (DUF488 family)
VRVHTIGHSNRPLRELIDLLQSFEIVTLADIRTIPRSRHNPQFNADALCESLREHGIRYVRVQELGGLRRARAGSQNTAWRNASFRGYADHMQSDEFEQGLSKLHELAGAGPIAIMCAEAVPWRCHRSLVADALLVRGAEVSHILGVKRASSHRLTDFARVDGERVWYPS